MGKLGATVAATDLAPNLPLLRDNCKDNGERQSKLHTSLLAAVCRVAWHERLFVFCGLQCNNSRRLPLDGMHHRILL
jgi:hypothetical protein